MGTSSFSIIDDACEIDENHCVISLIKQNKQRQDGHQGLLGWLVVEDLDENNNHVLYKIDFPFGSNDALQFSKFDLISKREFLKTFSGSTPPSINTISCSASSILKSSFNYNHLKESLNTATPTSFKFTESSYKKSSLYLEKSFGIKKVLNDEDPVYFPELYNADAPIQWNPFARIIESKLFPMARLSYSSFWQRIGDGFFILNGGFQKNDLGLLDYLFPIPRLLINLLALDMPIIAKLLIAIPTSLAVIVKTAIAFLTTLCLSPILGLTHLAFKFFAPARETLEETIKIRPVKGAIESFSDVIPEKDLEDAIPLSSFNKISERLTIKPLASTDSAHYEELSLQRPLKKENNEALAFGVYDNDTPLAIMEVNAENKPGIFNLMKANRYKIDTYIEEANVSSTPSVL